MLTEAFGKSTMSRIQVQLDLRKTIEDVNNDDSPHRPRTSTKNKNIEAMKKITVDNHQITITEIADDVGIPFYMYMFHQAIFTDD